jgi:hypothetical protein
MQNPGETALEVLAELESELTGKSIKSESLQKKIQRERGDQGRSKKRTGK